MADTRHEARRIALQGLYAMGESGQDDLRAWVEQLRELDDAPAPSAYSHKTLAMLCDAFAAHHRKARELLGRELRQPLERLAAIERSCLILAVCEQLGSPQTPRQIVISEWVKLGRAFGSPTGYKMVNKVLDDLEVAA